MELEINKHKLFSRAVFECFRTDNFYLMCNVKSNFHAIQIDAFLGIEKMYKYCPVCGEDISELIKKYFTS